MKFLKKAIKVSKVPVNDELPFTTNALSTLYLYHFFVHRIGAGVTVLILLGLSILTLMKVNVKVVGTYPSVFAITALILCTLAFRLAIEAYRRERTQQYRLAIIMAVIGAMAALILQLVGFKAVDEIFSAMHSIPFYGSLQWGIMASMLLLTLSVVVISAFFLVAAMNQTSDIGLAMLYFDDPFRAGQLKIVTTIWQYLTAWWLCFTSFYFLISF